jgi:hypothetical protein
LKNIITDNTQAPLIKYSIKVYPISKENETDEKFLCSIDSFEIIQENELFNKYIGLQSYEEFDSKDPDNLVKPEMWFILDFNGDLKSLENTKLTGEEDNIFIFDSSTVFDTWEDAIAHSGTIRQALDDICQLSWESKAK